jgi:hypothetical protein
MMSHRAAVSCLALLLSAACSQKGNSVMAGVPVAPSDVPHMRAGLWEEVWIFNGKSTPTKRYCDPGRAIFPLEKRGCTQYQISRTGPRSLIFDSICKDGDKTTILHKSVTGDFTSAFSADGTLDIPGLTRDVVHESYRYLGECPAGLAPEG